MVAYSGSKFYYGFSVYFQSILFLEEEVKKKGSREIYCLFSKKNLDEFRLKNIFGNFFEKRLDFSKKSDIIIITKGMENS